AQVVRGEQVQRDDADAGLVTPVQHVLDLGGADPMPVVGIDEPHLSGPSAVSVAHHADVARHRLSGELGLQPPLVYRVEQLPQSHLPETSDRRRIRTPRGENPVRIDWYVAFATTSHSPA